MRFIKLCIARRWGKRNVSKSVSPFTSRWFVLFDVHSLYKIHHVFQNETYTVNGEEISLIWNCFPGEESNSVEHDLTFFVQDPEEDVYHRFDECHVQRAYQVEELTEWLEEAGFTVLRVTVTLSDLKSQNKQSVFSSWRRKRIKQKQPRRLLLFCKEDVILI